MPFLFISHSNQDKPAVDRFVARLLHAGYGSLFLDYDPQKGIPAGRDWERELYSQLRRCDAVVFLASTSSTESRWCFAEISLARSLERPVFPVRLEPQATLPLLDHVQWVDLRNGEPDFARLLTGLNAAHLGPQQSPPWERGRVPYPGLAHFSSDDAAVFFGRTQEVDRLVQLLQPTLARGPNRFVAIVGPSGSGKSSLLHAGLLPRLAEQPARWLLLPPFVPGGDPMRRLAVILSKAFDDHASPRTPDVVGEALDRGPDELVRLAQELAELRVRRGRRDGRYPDVLVSIDQAEELVTRDTPQQQKEFLGLLKGALREESRLWVVATVRSEFLSSAPDRAGLAEAIEDPLLLEPLSRSRLSEVIARPAHLAELEFAPGLIERMIDETAGGDALPLLAYTLRRLAEDVLPQAEITAEHYDAIGGVVGALQHQADQLTTELGPRGLGSAVIPTLLRLVTVDPQNLPTRRRVPRSAFTDQQLQVIDAFVDARLLVSQQDAGTGQATIEVTHEALLRRWPPLQRAIEAQGHGLRLQADLERLAEDWRDNRNDESYLLRGARLEEAQEWSAQPGSLLPDLERAFLAASTEKARAERAGEVRRVRRLRVLAAALSALLMASVGAGATAIWQWRSAVDRQATATALALLARASAIRNDYPTTAQRLEIAAYRIRPSAETLSALRASVADSHSIGALDAFPAGVDSAALSPDAATVAVSSDHSISLWDVRNLAQPRRTGTVPADGRLVFSPTGLLAVVGYTSATLWNVRDPSRPAQTASIPRDGPGAALAFRRDGRLMALGINSDHVALVEIGPTGAAHPAGTFTAIDSAILDVSALAFNPGGTVLGVGVAQLQTAVGITLEETVSLWKVTDPRAPGLLARLSSAPNRYGTGTNSLAFNAKGNLLALSGSAPTLWNVGQPGRATAVTLADEPSAGSPVVAFSRKGQTLMTTSGNSAVLWDLGSANTPVRSATLSGHEDGITSANFDDSGKLLLTSGAKTVRLWSVDGRPPPRPKARLNSEYLAHSVAFGRDGTVVDGGDSGNISATIQGTRGAQRRPISVSTNPNQEAIVSSVALSPAVDGVVAAGNDVSQAAAIWDFRPPGQPHRIRLPHGDGILGVAFSPDGRSLAGNDPAGLFFGHAARWSSRRARWVVLRRSRGVPFQYASSRRRLRAQAMYTWSRRVLGSPR